MKTHTHIYIYIHSKYIYIYLIIISHKAIQYIIIRNNVIL